MWQPLAWLAIRAERDEPPSGHWRHRRSLESHAGVALVIAVTEGTGVTWITGATSAVHWTNQSAALSRLSIVVVRSTAEKGHVLPNRKVHQEATVLQNS